jgi:type IV secretion system protein VirB4
MKLKYTKSSKDKYFNKEFAQSNYIPYKCHWNNNTILTKKNELLQVLKFLVFRLKLLMMKI